MTTEYYPLRFYCHDCHTKIGYDSEPGVGTADDPTNNHGACKICGSDRWELG